MNEAQLKGALIKEARILLPTSYVVIRHEDRFTHGLPDISVTGNRITSWWECKLANPNFSSKGIQELTMLRLMRSGFAFYIVWVYNEIGRYTYIVNPNDIGKPITEWTHSVEGFDHKWLVEEIRKVHNDHH